MDILFTKFDLKFEASNKAIEDLSLSDLIIGLPHSTLYRCNFVGIRKDNQIKVIKSREAKPGQILQLKPKNKNQIAE